MRYAGPAQLLVSATTSSIALMHSVTMLASPPRLGTMTMVKVGKGGGIQTTSGTYSHPGLSTSSRREDRGQEATPRTFFGSGFTTPHPATIPNVVMLN
jgi:hypothetical protein